MISSATYKQFQPSELLRSYIDSYWFLEDENPIRGQLIDRVIPNIGYGLMFSYGNHLESKYIYQHKYTVNPAGLIASSTHYPVLIKSEGKRGIFGVKLKPHTVKMLLRVPAFEITNRSLSLEEVIGLEGLRLTQQIVNASNIDERIRIVESFLAFRLLNNLKNENQIVKFLISRIIQNKGNIILKTLSDECDVCERQLQRLFLQHVGVSPKFFARTYRINNVFDLLRTSNNLMWFDIVFRCGYFDQSHFIKEFKALSGITPEAFFRSKSIIADIFQGNKREIMEEELMYA